MLWRGLGAGMSALAVVLAVPVGGRAATDDQLARGKYLVEVIGCNDCHTPGYFIGKPDMTRFLGGSDTGFEIPGMGVFVGPNLTPDEETGLGAWSEEAIVTALQTGVDPDGRELAPIMPWRNFASLTTEDATAIAAFLKSLPPVHHAVPEPAAPGTTVSTFMMRLLPPGETAQQAPKP